MYFIKILHVLGSTNLGGAESRIMDLYRNINREEVQFDFLVHMNEKAYQKAVKEGIDPETRREAGYFDEEIRALGGQIYALPRFRIYNFLQYVWAIHRFFRIHKGEYQVVHGHMTSTAAIYLPIAKKYGKPVTIAHARSAGTDHGVKGILTKGLRRNLWKKADYLFTCSDLAAKAVFGREAIFIPNAVNTEDYLFDVKKRMRVREELGLKEDTFVVGHVGRFHYAKNHEYLLQVFAAFGKLDQKDSRNSVLLLLGDGPGLEMQKKLAEELGIADRVIFAGNQSQPAKYYHAMDCFVFPSRYEGLPGTLIEAQAAGLPCICSDAIAKESFVTDLVQWKSIEEQPEEWAKSLQKICDRHKEQFVQAERQEHALGERLAYCKIVADAGFDVKVQAGNLTSLYVQYIEKNKESAK